MNADAGPETTLAAHATKALLAAGFSEECAADWARARPQIQGDYEVDSPAFAQFFGLSKDLLRQLPAKPGRGQEEAGAAELIVVAAREARECFLSVHVQAVYSRLTSHYQKLIRLEDLVLDAARLVPGLTPSREEVAHESALSQGDKDGVEIDQGIFLCHVLNDEKSGSHLCHAMLLPREESIERLPYLIQHGAIDLGSASIERAGKACIATMSNPRFLNSEDSTTLDNSEIAVDLCLLDPHSEVVVLRGGLLDHPKYRGKRVFNAGINLTDLYHGKIPYLWYIQREFGFLNKIFRGLAQPGVTPEGTSGGTREKPWIAQVDKFAIGGGCQILLVMDYIVAGSDAYLTLPARKEGIIPGAANLRLPRFIGDRAARQAVMMDRRIDCDSPEGRLICDSVVAPGEVDNVVREVVDRYTDSGVVSAAGNRRAFRAACEPLSLFRQYMSVYAREQAYCHFSPALLRNLKLNWNADQRKR
jgi:(3,5-dihydroxyphenyl)acetyl-CoA 1,2-dioxygenase